jgi:cell division protein FtsZ
MESVIKKAIARAKSSVGTRKSEGERVSKTPKTDEELVKLLEASQAKIKVIGVGGGGCNTIERMTEVKIAGAETFGINTDAQDLLSTVCDKKILIGQELTKGLGSGSDPQVGESAARESLEELADALQDTDLVFITCGMGGGTGTGATAVIAEIAKEMKALTIGIVTLPFTVEGKKRMENAMYGLGNLRKHADTVIVIPNDKILEIAPDLPVNAAFKVADEVLTNAVKGITEMVTKPGLINLDFADLRTILQRGGAAMIGLGESRSSEAGEARALEAVEKALTSPLLDVDISDANRALINVIGGSDMTLREAEMIVETVSVKISDNAHIIWGAMIDDTIPKNQIQAMIVIAGGKFPYLDNSDAPVLRAKSGGEIDLGIKFT